MFPFGKIMRYTPALLGAEVRRLRKRLKVTQRDLALTSGTGLRFISELEKGKPTCQLGKVLCVLNTLGVDLHLVSPSAGHPASKESPDGANP